MGDTDKTLAYNVGADVGAFVQSMQKSADVAKDAAGQIESSFKRVHDVFGNVQKALLGLTAIMAGGAMFKGLISQAADWSSEAGKMGKQLGVSSEQASTLKVALQHLGIDADTYTGAAAKLSKQIFTNAQAFETLGVTIKDTATGAYRPVTQVMGEVNQKLLEIKNPIEQNIAGMQVYGKGWQEIKGILKITSDEMDRAEVRARQLGLVVGTEGVAAAKQYKEQLRDLSLVSTSLSVQFGNQLLPILTQTGRFMADEGPAAAQVFATVLKAIAFAAADVWLLLKDTGDGIGAFAAATVDLLTNGGKGLNAIAAARDEEFTKNEAAFQKMKARFSEPLPAITSAIAPDTDQGPKYNFKKEKKETPEKSRTGDWDAGLAEKKAARARESMEAGVLREYSKAEEKVYWDDIKAMAGLSAAERISVSKKAAEVETAMVRDSFEQKVRVLEAEAVQYKNNTDKRIELEQKIQAMYAAGTKGYEDAEKRINEIKRQASEQDKQVSQQKAEVLRADTLAKISSAEQSAQLEFELGNISKQQLLAMEQQFEDKRYLILDQAMQQRLVLASKDPDRNKVEVAKLNTEIELLMQQHELRLTEIRAAAIKDKAAPKMGGDAALSGGIEQSLTALLTNTKDVNKQLANIWKQSYDTFVQEMVTKPLAAAAMRTIKETALYQAVFGKQVAGQAAASGTVIGTKTAETAVVGGENAVQAGSGAFAALAAIPVIGPALAAVAGPAMFALVMAMVSRRATASAAGGYDIPSGINPLTQLHAREMVLPAKHADVIRNLAGPATGAATPGGGDIHLYVSATDAQSVARLFRDNGEHIVSALKRQSRNFAF